MKKTDPFAKSVFKDVSEYHDFAMKHQVFGEQAIKLKKEMDKRSNIPMPKVRGK